MTERDTLKFILFGTADSTEYADSVLDELLAAYGFTKTLGLLAEQQAGKAEELPSRVDEEGGLSLSWNDRAAAMKRLAEKCRRTEGSLTRPAPPSSVGLNSLWEKEDIYNY